MSKEAAKRPNKTLPNMGRYHFRWMVRADMKEVLDIERRCFRRDAWPEEEFIKAMRQRNVIGMVIEKEEAVVGFAIYSLHKLHLDIWNMAVHPEEQRIGGGTAIIYGLKRKLNRKLNRKRRVRIKTLVRESNVDACLFLKAMNFEVTDTFRDFYDDTEEDAYLFVYELGSDQ